MSFSFTVSGQAKAKALEAVRRAMDEVVTGQPIHARDHDAVISCAKAVADQLDRDDTKDVYVSINGSLGWRSNAAGEPEITSSTINAYAYLYDRPRR